jgi:hypothetical protein
MKTDDADMILLPGCLPGDRPTLQALCAGLPAHSAAASCLGAAKVEACHVSWTDAEREAGHFSGDLPAGRELAHLALKMAPTLALQPQSVAVATPLHAALGLTDLTATEAEQLALSEADSRALCAAASEHLRDEGVQFHFVDSLRWLVTCDRALAVRCERPEWMIGEALRPSLPCGADARTVERWMNELQMLLYTHPANIAREDSGQPPVNVVWLWGFSGLSADAASDPTVSPPDTRWLRAIRHGDVAAWQQAWNDVAPRLLSAGAILIGDHRPRLRLTARAPTVLSRLKSAFHRAPTLAQTLLSLQARA